eukprot:734446-Amphidinium_carterae.3
MREESYGTPPLKTWSHCLLGQCLLSVRPLRRPRLRMRLQRLVPCPELCTSIAVHPPDQHPNIDDHGQKQYLLRPQLLAHPCCSMKKCTRSNCCM